MGKKSATWQVPKASLDQDGHPYRGPWLRICGWGKIIIFGWGQRDNVRGTHWTMTINWFHGQCETEAMITVGGDGDHDSVFRVRFMLLYTLLLNFQMHRCPRYDTAYTLHKNGEKVYRCPRCWFGKLESSTHGKTPWGSPVMDDCLACKGSGFFMRHPRRCFVPVPKDPNRTDMFFTIKHQHHISGQDWPREFGLRFYWSKGATPVFVQTLNSPRGSWTRPNWKEGHHFWVHNYYDLADCILGSWQLDRVLLHQCRAEIPMPEGYYEVTLKIERWIRYRKRLGLIWKSRSITCDMTDGCLPCPGKHGDDDGIYGMGVQIDNPLRAVAEGIEKLAKRGLESRERYGGQNWRSWRPSPTHTAKTTRPADY